VVHTSLQLSARRQRVGGTSEATIGTVIIVASRLVILDALIEKTKVNEKLDLLSRLGLGRGLVCFQVVLNGGGEVAKEIVQVATILVESGDPRCSYCLRRIAGGIRVCMGNGLIKRLESLRELLESSVKDRFPVQDLNEVGGGLFSLRGGAFAEARLCPLQLRNERTKGIRRRCRFRGPVLLRLVERANRKLRS
jgi:hypothetical protein